MRRFMQTFVLAPQSPKKYYVHNDIFRYQDEVFHDNDTDTENQEDAQGNIKITQYFLLDSCQGVVAVVERCTQSRKFSADKFSLEWKVYQYQLKFQIFVQKTILKKGAVNICNLSESLHASVLQLLLMTILKMQLIVQKNWSKCWTEPTIEGCGFLTILKETAKKLKGNGLESYHLLKTIA